MRTEHGFTPRRGYARATWRQRDGIVASARDRYTRGVRARVLTLILVSLAVVSATPLGGCSSPIDIKSAPDSPVKSCQLAFLCARDCVRCVGDSCEEDTSCVARCISDHDELSPCGGEAPAAVGVDAAWGCEDGSFHDELFESKFVPGLCARDNISICGCRWSAYQCTDETCSVDGLTTSGSSTSTEFTTTDGTDGTAGTDGTETGTSTDTSAGTADTDGTGGTSDTDGTGETGSGTTGETDSTGTSSGGVTTGGS